MRNTKKRLLVWATVVASILMIPLLARAPWTVGDFVFAGVVLLGSASVYELVTKNMGNKAHRRIVGMAMLAMVVCIWGLAVSGE